MAQDSKLAKAQFLWDHASPVAPNDPAIAVVTLCNDRELLAAL